MDWRSGKVISAAVLLIAVTIVIVVAARNKRYLLVGWLWYLGTLTPVIGIVQVGHQAMADRYTYLPAVGIFIMVAWATAEILGKVRLGKVFMTVSSVSILAVLFDVHPDSKQAIGATVKTLFKRP